MGYFKLPFLLDGATGTNLFRAGMPRGVCVEKWILENPQHIMELQRQYAKAGSDAVMAPTFGANRVKLRSFGLEKQVNEYNKRLVSFSREAVGGNVLVAGDMSPTGLFVEPFGDTTFEELIDIFEEHAFALKEAGVDYIAAETMMSLTEARACLIAAKKTGLPVTVTLTVNENGKTLSGGDVLSNLLILESLGADAVGLNCSTGPDIVLKALKGASKHIRIPLIAKPNAGLPDEATGEYDVTPEAFADSVPLFFDEGISILGGCCGTSPEHISALREKMDRMNYSEPPRHSEEKLTAADERNIYTIDEKDLTLSEEIKCGENMSDSFEDVGDDACALIRLNSRGDAHEFSLSAYLLRSPVCFISDDINALTEALTLYQGKVFVDRRSEIEFSELEAICRSFGAQII